MSRPLTTPFAEAVYARLAPVAVEDEARGWPLLTYVVGLAQMFVRLEGIVRSSDARAPYSPLLDVNACPSFALPFLAQFVGVRLRTPNVGESADAWTAYARVAIAERSGRRRGTPAAMISAVQTVLTGTKSVRLLERAAGDAYALTVITRTAETPESDVPMTNLVLNPTAEDGSGSLNTNWSNLATHGLVAGSTWLNSIGPAADPRYNYAMRLITSGAAQGIAAQFGAITSGTVYRALVPIFLVSGSIEVYMRSSAGAVSTIATVSGPAGSWQMVPLAAWTAPANDADARVVTRQLGATAAEWWVGDVTVVTGALTPTYTWGAGAKPTTSIVKTAALTQKPAGIILTHQVSDFPLIDEGTRTINTSTGNIDTATIADIT